MHRGGDHLLQRTIAALASHGQHVTPVPTTGARTAGEIARTCVANGADLILVAGGDGTINEVANGMIHSKVPLGVIPSGTANVLAVELQIGTSAVHAAASLATWEQTRVAVGRIQNAYEERYFVLMAGIGLDAMIVYNINARLKVVAGKVAYWMGGFGHVVKSLPQFQVRIKDQEAFYGFALASRVRNYGGDLWIARGASLADNEFELVLFKGRHSLFYLKYLLGVLTGQLSRMKGVSIVKVQTAEFACPEDDRVYVQIDGEYFGRLPVTLSIVPDALTLLAPTSYLAAKRNG
jgi:diacylglycerol kinase (ATP)